jgi:hypothetical protein
MGSRNHESSGAGFLTKTFFQWRKTPILGGGNRHYGKIDSLVAETATTLNISSEVQPNEAAPKATAHLPRDGILTTGARSSAISLWSKRAPVLGLVVGRAASIVEVVKAETLSTTGESLSWGILG